MRSIAKHIFLILFLTTGMVTASWAQTVKGNVYGGGEMSQVDGNTNVTIHNGSLGADIFGGGEGALNNDGTVKASADVSGDTHVTINGGEFAVEYQDGNFKEHYNIYGGGNIASQVGETHVYVTKGMISNSSAGGSDFLDNDNADGIAKVYYEEGQMYFCIFGGGYGKNTSVTGDTWLDFHIGDGDGIQDITTTNIEDDLLEYQSYLDVIGGGFNGTVAGNTNVHIGGNAMCRDVFGGGLYATIGTEDDAEKGKTNVYITGGNVDNVYGGGVMGDIMTSTNVNIGLHETLSFDGHDYAVANDKVTVLMSVYGGNAVSGRVDTANVYHYGGTVEQNLFGAGNGDFTGYYTPGLCAYAEGENDNYYEVDHSGDTSTDGKGTKGPKGNTYKGRPQTGNVNITIAGNDTDDKAEVLGQVFGGGNSCTIGDWVTPTGGDAHGGNPHEWRDDPAYFLGGGSLNITLGSHTRIGRSHQDLIDAEDEEYLNKDGENVSGLFIGCSGRHLATQEIDTAHNGYHHYYDRVTAKYWPGFAVFDNAGNPLSRTEGLQSYNAYLNNILVWSDNVHLNIANDAEDIWLANFVGGGFRGSMKAKTAAGRFAYTLPEGVTVGNAIVGGAYNTDVVYRIFKTSDGHTYTTQDGHYEYQTEPGSLTQYDATTNPEGDYHHIEYAEDGTTINGIVRFYYDGGMLAENGGNRIHQVHAADDYATAYFEPLTAGDNQEDDATKAKLFTQNKDKAFLYLNLRCALEPEVLSNKAKAVAHSIHGGLVFGGCYMSGLVQGDSWIDYGAWLSPACANSTDPEMQHYFDKTNNMAVYDEAADLVNNNALNVFGAGFGENTHTAGDTYLYVKAVAQVAGGDGDKTGKYPYMFNAFGGSYAGRVYGNTNVYYASGKQGTLLGSLYGGGFLGDIDGNTFVELAEGFVTNVYGGSRQANIGGAAHVWAYDGLYRGIDDANHLIICNLYGGNDIAGTIRGTMSAPFAATRWGAATASHVSITDTLFNTYVEISSDAGSADRGFPLIGSAYAGGNGVQWEESLGTAPNVGKALIEIDGGSTLRAFGGGNMATVTNGTYILTDAHSTQFANVTFSEYQKNIMENVFFNGVSGGYTWNETTLTMDPYHVVNLYGGNNVAEMRIQPQWNLKSGYLENVYSGGNMGNMTYYNAGGAAATARTVNPTPKGLSIHVESDDISIMNLYGGCRMADVRAMDAEADTAIVMGENHYGATVNISGGRIHNVYGGNDIAGHVYNGTNVNIDGAISGDVYGSGNGDYIYMYDPSVEEGSVEERVHKNGYTYYAFHGDNAKPAEREKLQAINAIRPNVDKAYLNIAGSEDNLVYVTGNVYCGGNASTVSGDGSYTKFDIGSYCVLNGVYMGSNGELLAVENNIAKLREVNGISLNTAANLKEYMNAVAMEALPSNFTISNDITEAYIGTFCLGGNRGSMTTNQPVEITIPASVTIYNKVVGGCNQAYLSTGGTSTTGGFIAYNTNKTLPKIKLDIKAQFVPKKMNVPEAGADDFDAMKAKNFLDDPIEDGMLDDKYCNVYGGCYTRGYVYGDVEINMYSDMIADFDTVVLKNNIAYNETHGRPVFSVFGGGYGQNTVIYGNTHIRLLNNNNRLSGEVGTAEVKHPSVNAIYGGGEQGKMIGTSTIHIADGIVYSNVVGGALNGSIYGNTEILVGYPSYYEVQKTGEYLLKRSNFTSGELDKEDGSGRKAVKQSIFLTKGDRINAAVHQAIVDWDTEKSTHQAEALTLTQNKVRKDWDDIAITIKGGIYGGGYARENVEDGQTAMANTVLKFTSAYNLATAHPEYWADTASLSGNAISADNDGQFQYGGNSTIWVQDEINASNWKDGSEHITISTETDPVAHTGIGGIFGDGHSSLVAAFRSAAVEGYGYAEHAANAPKLLNTFQRFDILQIRDCSMKMYGQIDVATGQNDPTLYSVSRITELMLNSNIDDSGNLNGTDQLNARNVIDFYNPVHFLGSITSEVTFKPGVTGSRYHDRTGRVVSDTSYYDYKSAKVAKNYNYAEKRISTIDGYKEDFALRNVGTAKNLIRIDDPMGRGVHLKVVQENNYTLNAQGVREEQSFYGPLSGVFEFELTNVNARGGGYVYSNNLHEQTIAQSNAEHPGSKPTEESFLQTSGNVFFKPIHLDIPGHDDERSVYDDCYPIPYSNRGDGELDKAHYWFVEGDGPTWCSYPEEPTTIEGTTITIETAEQLAWIYDYIDQGHDSGKESSDPENYDSKYDKYPAGFAGWTIQLGNDIDLGQLTILDQKEVPMIWCPVADQHGKAFEGTFDGNGYKIDGMLLDIDYITTKDTYGHEHYSDQYDHYFGLFAKTSGATIKNVELSNAKVINYNGNINEQVHIGTLITEVNGTTVQDCSVQQTDTITTTQSDAVAAAAAFICHTAGDASTIKRNFVSGTIEANSAAVTAPISGFISTLGHGSTMEHCYSLVDVRAQQVAGLSNTIDNATLEHSYYAGTLTRTNGATEWGAILANATNATVKHCYYDKTKNDPDKEGAGGYRGGDGTVFSSKASGYTSWSTFGLTTAEMSGAQDHQVWRSCYSHGHSASEEAEAYRCHLDADDALLTGQESAWNKGIWFYINGFYPLLKAQEIDCSALTTAFVMPTAESLELTTKTDLDDSEDGWFYIDKNFQLPTYGHMYWTSNNNTLLLDSSSNKAQNKVNAHLYLGGPDALTLNCDEYVRWMQEIYVTREDINNPADMVWLDSLQEKHPMALDGIKAQLNVSSFTAGMLRNKEVTNISKKAAGVYAENGFDGDLHIWNREGSAGSVTNQRNYTVNGTVTYYTGYTNPFLWHEVNIPFSVANTTVHRSKTDKEYAISARTSDLEEDEDGGNFWLRSFDDGGEVLYGGSTFQQAWHDPAVGENYGHRPSVLRFPKKMKVDTDDDGVPETYKSGDYWCYAQDNKIDGTDFHNGGSEIRFYSSTGNTIYGTQDFIGHEDSRGAGNGYSFIVYGNPTLGNIQLEGFYWTLESVKRDTTGVNDKVIPEVNTTIAQWFSLEQDPLIAPLGIWLDGPENFKQQALDGGSAAPLRMPAMYESDVNEVVGKKEPTFTATGFNGLLGVFSYIDQVINIYDTTGRLLFTTPVRANTGFTLNLPNALYVACGSQSPKQVKVLL